MGIGPTQPAWKAGVLPLNYTRILATDINIAYRTGICQVFLKFFPEFFSISGKKFFIQKQKLFVFFFLNLANSKSTLKKYDFFEN